MPESPASIPQLLTTLLTPEFVKWILKLLLDFWHTSRFDGTYRVHQHDVELELLDLEGKRAKYSKVQKVEYLHNEITAIQDQAWGDGELFAEYKCTPGVVVDSYKEGYRFRLLLSLRGTRNRGDTETISVERTILDGFTSAVGNFQTQVDHPTRKLAIAVIFPKSHLPNTATFITQNSRRHLIASDRHKRQLPDGRLKIQWVVEKPYLYEGYSIRWEW